MESLIPVRRHRFRANSIVEKSRTRTVLPLRFFQFALFCALLFFGFEIYTRWIHCDNNIICSRVFRNDLGYHKLIQEDNIDKVHLLNNSLEQVKQQQHIIDTSQQLNLDIKDFYLPSDIILDAKSPLWLSKGYFHQSSESAHRAFGYGNETDLQDAPYIRASLLRHLLHALDAFSKETDFVFWLAHGTLLGQYWGEKIMAEDTDVDVQTSIGALHQVRNHANKLFRDRFELHINPHYVIRKSSNYFQEKSESNVIDARWVDTLSGHFIDITALATSEAAAEQLQWKEEDHRIEKFKGTSISTNLQDKSIHYFKYPSISPLKQCTFEDRLFWCPADSNAVLLDEYPKYKNPHHLSWRFDSKRKIFVRMTCERLLKMYTWPSKEDCDEECKEVVANERILDWIYLVVPWEHRNQCQLEVTWGNEPNKVTRTYRGIHDGEDPGKKIFTNRFHAVFWS